MIDKLDAELIALLAAEPRLGVFEASRRLGVARGTVQARLDRLQRSGVVRDFAPTVDTDRLGYPVTAFVTVELTSGEDARHAAVAEHLRHIPEVLEVHTITGAGDLMVRAVARTNIDLQRVIGRIDGYPAVARTSTVIALTTVIDHRTVPLVQAAVGPDDADATTEEEHG
ncbi:Lrp/AsnC family transcriptional regulator [Leifsonia sp. 2MCAF36]|uniref:Lrp/AsnC family transcriptional regulator n=1 Tax=Leifsonia sp. 2MCAF36 TaxID=3232988 RepID=UPI003F9D7B96